MLTIPYVYRKGITGVTTTDIGELPGKICNVNQAIWMTARRDTLSGATLNPTPPCLQCVTTWKDQSVNIATNDATLMNSVRASTPPQYPFYNADYWTGDTTSNFKPFLSFDRKNASGVNRPNFLAIPYNTSFSRLSALTFSTIFRCRRISPNPVIYPDDATGANVVLVQNGNSTSSLGPRTDGWGIDMGGSNELRVWYHNSGAPSCSEDPAVANGKIFNIPDWTKWMRLTVRISGGTLQANIYNLENFQTSGNTWWNGCGNSQNVPIYYAPLPVQDWFIAAQKGPGYPSASGDQTILNGSWDILEYVLYDSWLSDSCIQTIWDYYKAQYNFGKTTGSASTYTQIGAVGSVSTTTAPVNLGFNYYWSGMIIPRLSINRTGVISELQYYIDNSPTNNVLNNVKIYIGYTTSTAFSTTPSENFSSFVTDWTLAYDGTLTFNSSPGWSKISLQNGFYFNNLKNLVIKFESRDGSQGSTGQPSFKYETASSTMAYGSSNTAYPTGIGTRGNDRPIIKLGFL